MKNINVTSAKYNSFNGKNASIQATIDGVEWSIPLDPANRHYQAILEWVAEGNTIEEAD
jgi:hypothetical protein